MRNCERCGDTTEASRIYCGSICTGASRAAADFARDPSQPGTECGAPQIDAAYAREWKNLTGAEPCWGSDGQPGGSSYRLTDN